MAQCVVSGQPIVPQRLTQAASSDVGGANGLFNATNATSNSISSATYVNVTIGGNAVQVQVAKALATTDLVVRASMDTQTPNSATPYCTLGVNDGAADWDLAAGVIPTNSNTNSNQLAGGVNITGLSAGTKTLTLRAKSNGTNAFLCPAGGSITLRVIEADGT